MKLYHYASAKGEPDDALKASSLLCFLDPVPVTKMPDYFAKKKYEHPFWHDGHEIIEYEIDLTSEPGGFAYHVQDLTMQSLDILEAHKQEKLDDRQFDEIYCVAEKDLGPEGSTLKALESCVKELRQYMADEYITHCLDYFIKYAFQKTWESKKSHMAPWIPHVTISANGPIKVRAHRTITVGTPGKPAMLSW